MNDFFAALLEDLRPSPERHRKSAFTALATTTALAIAVALQNGSFTAVLIGYMALMPNVVCTWRNLIRRVALVVTAAILFLPFGAVLIQLPWLLVPALFVLVAAILYYAPVAARPMESLGLLFVVVMTLYVGVLEPENLGWSTLDLIGGYVIGLIVATAFAYIAGTTHPHDRLTAALAANFTSARNRLAEAQRRFRAPEWEPAPDKSTFDVGLGQHLQLYELVRQEAPPYPVQRALLGFTTVAARCNAFIDTLDVLSRENCGREYRRRIEPELGNLLEALDEALAAFARGSACIDRFVGDAVAEHPAEWPELDDLVAALQKKQLDLRHAGNLSDIGVVEAGNGHAFAQGVTGLAAALRVSPSELAHLEGAGVDPSAPQPTLLPALDPFALRYASQAALATVITFLCGMLASVPEMVTALWTVLFIAQFSYGATLRRAELRIAGLLLGGLFGIATIITVFPNVNELPALMLVFFVVVFVGHSIALSGDRFGYAGVTTVAVFSMAMTSIQPLTDVRLVLWRIFATLLGVVCLFTVFRVIAPDYAGRQLVARLRGIVGLALAQLTPLGKPAPTTRRRIAMQRELARAHGDLLRLVGETRVEGEKSGVDTRAAVDATGIATRIALRCGLIARSRDMTWPALSPGMAEALERAVDAARGWLGLLYDVLDARHTMARPGSAAHDEARAAAEAIARRPRPDLAGAVTALDEHLDRVRFTEFADWPAAAASAFFAEVAHLHRLAKLVPMLDETLQRTLLPGVSLSSELAASVPLSIQPSPS